MAKMLRLVVDGHQDLMAKSDLAYRVIVIELGWWASLLCRHEDLNHDPQHSCRNPGTVVFVSSPGTQRGDRGS